MQTEHAREYFFLIFFVLNSTILQDPELGGVVPSISRKCEDDNISLASSTHFTMIGGASARGRRSGGCCSHSHRITALVLTMSVIFLVGITVAVFLLESKCDQLFTNAEIYYKLTKFKWVITEC
jgi:hypothetical protein